MRRLVHIVASLVILGAWVAHAEPTLEVSANRDRLYVGESFLLEIKVGGASQPGEPDLSQIKNCLTERLGSNPINFQNVSLVNGHWHRTGFAGRVFTYKLTPAKAGELTLGPISVQAEGVTLSQPGPAVTVTGITKQDIVNISVLASRDTVLVDEPFEIRLLVRIRNLPGRFAGTDPLYPSAPPNLNAPFLNLTEIDGLKGPDLNRLLTERLIGGNQPGFTVNEHTVQNNAFDFSRFFNAQQNVPARFRLDRQPGKEDGTPCWEYSLTLPYTAVTEGAYTFGPVVFKGSVPTNVNDRGEADGTEIFAVGPAAIVRVVPPPEENRPESYIGAIGSNLVATASLDAQTCNVGDPLKLTLSLSGSIQLQNIFPPRLGLQTNLLAHFEVYDDTVQTAKQTDGRQYSYTLRPRHAGAFELPPIEISYYDVRVRRYRTITTIPIPLKVRQSVEVTASQVIGGSTNPAVQVRRTDEAAMQPAGIRLDPFATEPGRLAGNRLLSAAVAASGPLVFLASLMLILYRKHREALARFRKRRRALAHAHRLLRAAPTAPGALNTAVCHAMRQYLSDRLSRPADSATPDEAQAMLIDHGVALDTARHFSEVMRAHFNATFGAGPAPDLQQVYAVLTAVDRALSRTRGKPHLGVQTGAGRALLAVLMLGAPLTLLASTDAERDFIWSEANSQLISAHASREYLAAAVTYQRLVDRGVDNATVFYNQGTALLLAEKYAEAVQVLHRAERYGGSGPDIRRNLAIAQGRLEGLKTPVTSWQRIALFWHFGLSCATRTLISAAAFALLWLAGALRLLGSRNTARTLFAVAMLVFLLFGASVLTTLQQENQSARPAALLGLD